VEAAVSTDAASHGSQGSSPVITSGSNGPSKADRLDAFISYARRPRDREFVDWLSGALRQRGKQIWLDRSNIEPAADWWTRITRGVRQANARIMQRMIPRSELHSYHAGHLELIAEPGRLAPVIETFLDRHTEPVATQERWRR
jgi:hypothetical protein